jgi:WD40 repeat protein
MGKNVHAEFGRTEDEVVVFSDFASKATVWCLRTGRTVEIRDPKFSGKDGRGWGYRPSAEEKAPERGGMLAILCRSAGQDILLLLAPKTYDVVRKVELPTVDAAGLKWSRDGRWIAVWDAASSGYHLHIYTADGHLYRTMCRETSDDLDRWGVEGLGIKSVEWVPGNQYLGVGGWDRRVRILSTRTFSLVVFLDHTTEIQVPTAPVYTELVDSSGERSYSFTQQPVTPPKATTEKGDTGMKQGISIVSFNLDGTLCATRDDSTPSTIWIWDLRSLRPKTILLQYATVKSLQWHPSNPSLLLIQSVHDSPTVYLYSVPELSNSSSSPAPGPPQILNLTKSIAKPTGPLAAKWDAKWLATPEDKKPALVFGHQQGYVLVWPEGKDKILRFENEDGEQSDDSLYDILTGRTPIPRLRHAEDRHVSDDDMDDDSGAFVGVGMDGTVEETYDISAGSFEDTFREKRRGLAATATETSGQSVFDESGLDEMF